MSAPRKDQFDQNDWSLSGSSFIDLTTKEDDASIETSGTYYGPDGIVGIWVIKWKRSSSDWTALQVVHNGRMMRRTWQRAWCRRTLPGLCRKFLEDLAA